MTGSVNNVNRRRFLQISSGSLAAMFLPQIPLNAGETSKTRPNILWVSCEDISPDLGCYGDSYAVSPNIDKLASQGVRYNNVYSHSGVCAPTRSGIITGMYPTTIGTHHICAARVCRLPMLNVSVNTSGLRAIIVLTTQKPIINLIHPQVLGMKAAARHIGGAALRASRSSLFSISQLHTKVKYATEAKIC